MVCKLPTKWMPEFFDSKNPKNVFFRRFSRWMRYDSQIVLFVFRDHRRDNPEDSSRVCLVSRHCWSFIPLHSQLPGKTSE